MAKNNNEVVLFVTTKTDAAYYTTMKLFNSYNQAFITWRREWGHNRSITYRVKRKHVEKIIKKLEKIWKVGDYTITYDSDRDVVKIIF